MKRILCLLLSVTTLHGAILDHVVPIENKTLGHNMQNIDFIYLINLDSRPEKYERSREQLLPYGIEPFRISAIYGKELPREVINDLGVKCSPEVNKKLKASWFPLNPHLPRRDERMYKEGRTYFCHQLPFGAIGCVMSHLSVLSDAYDSGYGTVWIMEDDIEVIQDPHLLSTLIDELDATVGKEGWDVLFTDYDTRNAKGEYVPCKGPGIRPDMSLENLAVYSVNKNVGEKFRQVGARFGSYSMIVRRSGIEKILSYYEKHQMFLGYDCENFLAEGIRLFTVRQDVVAHLIDAPSDIATVAH